MFPYNATSTFGEIVGATTVQVLATSTYRTILHVDFQEDGVSGNTTLRCGPVKIFRSYSINSGELDAVTLCQNNALYITKTGADTSFYVITYVPYNLASSTLPSSGTSTSLTFPFTYGDFMFTSSVIIALLSVIMWRLIFKK